MFPYKAYMTLQQKELEEHKEYLKLKDSNAEITEEYTLEHWIYSGRAKRFNSYYQNHTEHIGDVCNTLCSTRENCAQVEYCPMTLDLVHRLLEDFAEYKKEEPTE